MCRRLRVRADHPGRARAGGRGDHGRRPPDAPPPRRPARAHARPARRRASRAVSRSRRCGPRKAASTGASATGWPRSAPTSRSRRTTTRFVVRRRLARDVAARDRRGGCAALPAGLRPRRDRDDRACSRARERWWNGRVLADSEWRRSGGGELTFARARATTAARRPTRSTALNFAYEDGLPKGTTARRRGHGRRAVGNRGGLALPARHRLDGQDRGRAAAGRPPVAPAPARAERA